MNFSPQYFFYLLCTVFIFSFCSENNNENVTVEHELNKGYFLQSTNSNWKSKYYDYIESSGHALFAVAEKQSFGVIDKNENIIIPFEYEFVEIFNSVILAHPLPGKHDLHAHIIVFDHSGKKLFSQELMSCTPVGDQLIACSKNQMEGGIFNLKGKELYQYNAQEKVREVLPNIIEYKSAKGELQYIDNQGAKVTTPKYLPRYLTYKNYEENYMVVNDQEGQPFLLDKNNQIVDLPDGYIAQGVKHDFAVLKTEEGKYFIYDLKNKKLLDNTSSTQFIKINKCEQEGNTPMFYFNDIYNYIEGKRELKCVNQSNETLSIFSNPDPNQRVDEEKYIQNFCDPSGEKYFFKRRIASSNNFECYEGLNGETYFKDKNTQEIHLKNGWFLGNGIASAFDKYAIVYQRNKVDNTNKCGLINLNMELVIPFEYDKITVDYNLGFFILHKGNKMGMTDKDANIILEARFDDVSKMTSYYKKSGVLLTKNENKYQIFSFAGVPFDDEIYTKKTQEENSFVRKPIVLSNEKTKISIDGHARINRNPK